MPACPVRPATAGELRAWARAARPGETFVYLTAPAMVQGPAARAAAALYRDGLVDLRSKPRSDCGGFDFLVERIGPRGGRGRKARLAVRDAAAARILGVLRRAAEAGRPCPSDTVLARIAGLPSRKQAGHRIAKLVAEGRIRTETWDGPSGPVRVVEIAANGWRTAGGPSPAGGRHE